MWPRVVDVHRVAQRVWPFRNNGRRQANKGDCLEMGVAALMRRLGDSSERSGKLGRKPVIQLWKCRQREKKRPDRETAAGARNQRSRPIRLDVGENSLQLARKSRPPTRVVGRASHGALNL